MVTDIMIVIGIAILAGALAWIVDICRKKNVNNTISFRETIDLTGLPIITFKNNGQKVNFILDTGSNSSVINQRVLSSLKYEKTNKKTSLYGSDGNKEIKEFINMSIEHGDNSYSEEFLVTNLDEAFDNMKRDYGVNLAGILGNSFFQKYKYIFDFDKLVAYTLK